MEFRGLLGALIAFVLLLALQSYLVKYARSRATEKGTKRDVKFMDLIITSEDERYSLSRFQMYLWTVFVIIGFARYSWLPLRSLRSRKIYIPNNA